MITIPNEKTTSPELCLEVFEACRLGDFNAVESMLKAGVSANLRHGKVSLLREAVRSSQHEIVDILLAGGGSVNRLNGGFESVLFEAVRKKDFAMVSKLIAAGANVNAVRKMNGEDSVLLLAAYGGDKKICVELIKSGARWWESSEDEHWMLSRLLEIDDGSILATISSQKKWSTKTSKFGSTFAHLASRFGKTELLQRAIEAGAFINAPEKMWGYTMLHHAFLANSPACVAYLLKARASVCVRDTEGNTPFDLGIQCEKVDAVVAYMKIKKLSPFDSITKSVSKRYKNKFLKDLFVWSPKALQKLEGLCQAYMSMQAAKALEAVFLGAAEPAYVAAEQPVRKRLSSMQL